MKNIIHIFGPSGAGTSTLGRKICRELGYTFMDTDDYYWLPTDPPYTEKRDVQERLRLIKEDIVKAEDVVLSGALSGWGDELIALFTLAVRLETETEIRLERLRRRERQAFGTRIDPGGDMYQNHKEFLAWAAAYDTGGVDMRSRARHDTWQKLLKCSLLELDGAASLEENCWRVCEALL